MIVINTKNYKFSKELDNLLKNISKFSNKKNKLIVAIPPQESRIALNKTISKKIDIFSQSVSSKDSGRNTGFITIENALKLGIKGSLINHSENKISLEEINNILNKSNKLKFKIIICTSSISQLKELLNLQFAPYAIAFEDEELISTSKSVTEYNPKTIIEFVKILQESNNQKNTKIIPLCGAGISNINDVNSSFKLGCKGCLIASAIASVKNPSQFLKEISKLK